MQTAPPTEKNASSEGGKKQWSNAKARTQAAVAPTIAVNGALNTIGKVRAKPPSIAPASAATGKVNKNNAIAMN
jgi:hypothetical protein